MNTRVNIYCLHCGKLIATFFNPVRGEMPCAICGSLNQYDTANLQAQACELPLGHICDPTICKGLSKSVGVPALRGTPESKES
jgi:hypothetical protein